MSKSIKKGKLPATKSIPILYEDKDVIVLDKPAGLIVHADGKTDEPTLVDWLVAKYPKIVGIGEKTVLSNGNEINRSGIVHRLDRETSGAIIVAKNQPTFLFLKRQFSRRQISKAYHAFVHQWLKKDDGTIDKPIGRSAHHFREKSVSPDAVGLRREALTYYRALGRLSEAGKNFSFVEVLPKTGRTHQIRVHLKSIGHPVVCDKLYAPRLPAALGFSRLALHSRTLIFRNSSGEQVSVEAPYPRDFRSAVKKLQGAITK